MSRICLVGIGLPSLVAGSSHCGPGLRSGHFAGALAEAGHDVLLLYLDHAAVAGASLADAQTIAPGVLALAAPEPDFVPGSLATVAQDFGASALVGCTAYGSSLALRLELGLPTWADLMGDLMAEAQAKAALLGDDSCLVHFWSLLGPVLAGADRFSAVSQAQADALVGQLGLAGRLSSATAGERLVEVVRCAAELPAERGGQADSGILSELPDDAFVAAWAGSFNTWCDVDLLFDGVDSAMAENPSLHLLVTGGEVEGHDGVTWRRFLDLVEGSRQRDRYHLLGRVEDSVLAEVYRRSDVGLVVEKDLYERQLGAENRVVQWMAHGVPVLTTYRSPAGRDLVQRGLSFAITGRSAEGLAESLLALVDDPARLAAASLACTREAREAWTVSAVAAPLLAWCASPVRAGDAGAEPVLRVGLFSEPAAIVHLLESYLASLGPAQIAYRAPRWLLRRLLRSVSSAGKGKDKLSDRRTDESGDRVVEKITGAA
jgi:glycosyltransferase involved in cell wall biosynthesis